ncbi:MAG: TIGR02757 family protein [Bacteroidales bacterium]|nr:TIGR02757 family protein [Bacteroidales bacterium]
MSDLKLFLDNQFEIYNSEGFIIKDPISIPRRFTKKEDIEISGFLTAIISWGNRTAILKSADYLMEVMENEPYNFIKQGSEKEWNRLSSYLYRTFNSDDLFFLLAALKDTYLSHGGLEEIFSKHYTVHQNIKYSIVGLRSHLLNTAHLKRSEKHLANPEKGSAAKRINMFLRWMIRNDDNGVDFGLWEKIPMSALMIPLDLHSGTVARRLGLLKRKQDDWKAVEELTSKLREFDPNDPVKYDFALFGMGINKHFTELNK